MIFDDIDESLLSYTIEKYGAEHQIIVAIEELSELIKELCKHRRGKDNKAAIIEEMADCCIMLEQLQLIFGVSNRTLRQAAIDKLDRLVDRLAIGYETNKNGKESGLQMTKTKREKQMCDKLVKLMNEASKYAEQACRTMTCKACNEHYEAIKNGKENCMDILAAYYLIQNGVVLKDGE